MTITLDFVGLDEAGELMAFIRDHWSARHVLARSRAMLDWQHRDEAAGRYNFLVARKGGCIAGMLGFIPSSRYDPALAETRETVWLTTWRVVEGAGTGLGLMLMRELAGRLAPRWIGTAGLNPKTRAVYDAMGYRTGRMTRHYRLGATAGERLAQVPADWPAARPASTGGTLAQVGAADIEALDASGERPAKTPAQFRARYLDHPFYTYRLYHAATGAATAVIATRLCEHDGASALRIVDLLGDPAALAGCGEAFDRLLAETGAEYADFYCSQRIEPLVEAGFDTLLLDDPLVLPSYFEPFDRCNVDILWSLDGLGGNPGDMPVICKGDCDQDRPSMLGEL